MFRASSLTLLFSILCFTEIRAQSYLQNQDTIRLFYPSANFDSLFQQAIWVNPIAIEGGVKANFGLELWVDKNGKIENYCIDGRLHGIYLPSIERLMLIARIYFTDRQTFPTRININLKFDEKNDIRFKYVDNTLKYEKEVYYIKKPNIISHKIREWVVVQEQGGMGHSKSFCNDRLYNASDSFVDSIFWRLDSAAFCFKPYKRGVRYMLHKRCDSSRNVLKIDTTQSLPVKNIQSVIQMDLNNLCSNLLNSNVNCPQGADFQITSDEILVFLIQESEQKKIKLSKKEFNKLAKFDMISQIDTVKRKINECDFHKEIACNTFRAITHYYEKITFLFITIDNDTIVFEGKRNHLWSMPWTIYFQGKEFHSSNPAIGRFLWAHLPKDALLRELYSPYQIINYALSGVYTRF